MAATPESVAAPAGGAAAAPLLDQWRAAFARLNNQQKLILMVASALIIAVLIGGMLWSRAPDYRILFSNVSERDGGAIISALEQLNVPYRFSEGSGSILVPADKVHEARLRLATQGLPKGGNVGFELMENQKFGISQFAEQVNYQRALEGELARTIMAIGAVQNARVHLAIPKPSVFVREQQKPTASVFVHLYPGRVLEPAQVAGITHLVASSVPQLPPGSVSIVDQGGALLSQMRSKLTDMGLDPSQIKYVQEVEASVIKRIEDILLPLTGPGNARVQVAADIDFSQTEQTAETFRPNLDPQAVAIRSQQTSEAVSVTPSPQGVPGALSNQPPVPATAPITSPPVPGQAGTPPAVPTQGQIAAGGVTAQINSVGQPLNSTKNATTNYEIDKTIRHTKSSLGAIKRLSVAVVVNHRRDTDRNGKPTTKPLSDSEVQQINALVREAMGFSQERGDTLSVVNSAFTLIETTEPQVPFWQQPQNVDLAKDMFKYLLIAAVIAYLLLGVVRPILRAMFPEPASGGAAGAAGGAGGAGGPGQLLDVVDEEEASINMALASYEHKLERARQIATDEPKMVANIIKDWMSPNG